MSLPKDIANIGSIANAVYNSITANTTAITSINAAVVDINTGTAIASAATVNLNIATGNRVHITGTTTITAVTLTRGPRTVIFDDVLTLTHHATTNNLPGANNITTAAGDRAIYEGDGTTVFCVNYIKASGTAVVAAATGFTLGTPVVTTSGTAINFTGIPAGTTQIVINFKNVGINATSDLLVQIGDSGGVETTNYAASGVGLSSGSTAQVTGSTSGFVSRPFNDGAGTARVHGMMTLTLENATSFTWVASGVLINSINNAGFPNAGSKSLSATLDRLQINAGGTSTFVAGEINIAYS